MAFNVKVVGIDSLFTRFRKLDCSSSPHLGEKKYIVLGETQSENLV